MRAAARRQAGFTLAVGIFLLVILAALGAFVLSVSSSQHIGAAWDVLGVRAYHTARAGIEWGAYEAMRNARCSGRSSFSPGGTLTEFTVTVQATAAPAADELGVAVRVCELVATACNRPAAGECPGSAGANYIERQLQVSVAY